MSKTFKKDFQAVLDRIVAVEKTAGVTKSGIAKRQAAFLGLETGVFFNLTKTGLSGRHMQRFIQHSIESYLKIEMNEFGDLYMDRMFKYAMLTTDDLSNEEVGVEETKADDTDDEEF